MTRILLHGASVLSDGIESKDNVLVEDGKILDIARYIEEFDETIELSGKILTPGFIDCHVHFREPGLEAKETLKTGAEAAIAGGVTTVCEMPNTIPPTVTAAALADKIRRAADIKGCDMRFFFGITEDIHLATLLELLDASDAESIRLRSRIAGVKIYLDHSTGNQKIADQLLDDVFAACAAHELVLVAHCEDPATNAQAAAQNTRTTIAAHSLVRPAQSEVVAIERALALAQDHDTKLHIAHLSTEGGIAAVKEAKVEGIRVTCEVAPHHLFLTTDDYERLGTFGKMNPPLRSQKHRFALWQGIIDGVVDCISTDHAPHTLEEKQSGEPLKAPSGVPGVETMIPLLLSVVAKKWPNPAEQNAPCPQLTLQDIVRLCFENPNSIFKLGKQSIAKGNTADIVVIDPVAEWTIDAKKLHSKCGWSPFDGWTVTGKVERVIQGSR